MWFGDMSAYGSLTPQPGPPQWSGKIEDYNPDRCRSWSALYVEEKQGSVLWAMQVKGIGVIVMRATSDKDGNILFNGVSIFSKEDIGCAPGL